MEIETQRRSARSWVRTVYLYTLALVGLLLVVIGGIRLLDMGLKAFVFTQAEQEERLSYMQPPMPMPPERMRRLAEDEGQEPLTEEERVAIRQWVREHDAWRERRERVDPIVSRRQRDASSSLAMILIGLPLYLYHWSLIRRETRSAPD